MSERKPRILIFLAPYLPGIRSGGPVRSIASMIDAMAPYYDFFVATRDRDFGDRRPYDNVVPNQWNRLGDAQIYYARRLSPSTLLKIVREVVPDLLYSNGFFCRLTIHVLLLRMMGLLPAVPFVLAPRGEFNPGALGLKQWKKRPFLRLASAIGLYDGITLHASCEQERTNTGSVLGQCRIEVASLQVAVEVTRRSREQAQRKHKEPGKATFVCVSRVSRMKNIEYLLDRLAQLRGEVVFDLYGPLESRDIWENCRRKIATMPANIRARHCGELHHSMVADVLTAYDFFAMATLGENFGHSIVEALAVGLPVIISDRTPWRGLYDLRAGLDLPLEDEDGWVKGLQWAVDMGHQTYSEFSAAALKFASQFTLERSIQQHRALFDAALHGTVPAAAVPGD